MHTHIILPWAPVPFEPKKRSVKPRKVFVSEEPAETDAPQRRLGPEDDFDEPEYRKTDIRA